MKVHPDKLGGKEMTMFREGNEASLKSMNGFLDTANEVFTGAHDAHDAHRRVAGDEYTFTFHVILDGRDKERQEDEDGDDRIAPGGGPLSFFNPMLPRYFCFFPQKKRR